MLTMHLSQWTTNQETYMVTICTFIKSNKVSTPRFFSSINQVTFSRLSGWSPDRQGSSPRHLALVSVAGWPLHSESPVQPAGWTHSNWTRPRWGFCIASKVSKSLFEKNQKSAWRQRSSSQLLRASGQSRGFQVTLKFSYCTSVQGAKIKVKSSVCDVEVSGLFNEVHNLENRGHSGYFCSHLQTWKHFTAQTIHIFTVYGQISGSEITSFSTQSASLQKISNITVLLIMYWAFYVTIRIHEQKVPVLRAVLRQIIPLVSLSDLICEIAWNKLLLVCKADLKHTGKFCIY